jgi:hypothetical protein
MPKLVHLTMPTTHQIICALLNNLETSKVHKTQKMKMNIEME